MTAKRRTTKAFPRVRTPRQVGVNHRLRYPVSSKVGLLPLSFARNIDRNFIGPIKDDEDGEYNEDEFLGILALARQARERYTESRALHDLEDSIAYLRDTLSVAPTDPIARADVLHMLAYDLYTLYQENGEHTTARGIVDESLNDSIRLHRQAVKLLPSQHPYRAVYITRLAIALRARYTRAVTPRDLEECIVLHHRALSMFPEGHPDRAQSLLNLANAHWTRFEHTDDLTDLDQAIKYDREALELRPPGHPNRAAALLSLATELGARYRRTQQSHDVDEAMALQAEALPLLAVDDVCKITYSLSLRSLSSFLQHVIQPGGPRGRRKDP